MHNPHPTILSHRNGHRRLGHRVHRRGHQRGAQADVPRDLAGEIDIVINTPRGRSARADGYEIRTATVAADKALFTTIAQVGAAVASLEERPEHPEVKSLQDYAVERLTA